LLAPITASISGSALPLPLADDFDRLAHLGGALRVPLGVAQGEEDQHLDVVGDFGLVPFGPRGRADGGEGA
jgi:hypothetical protein